MDAMGNGSFFDVLLLESPADSLRKEFLGWLAGYSMPW